MKKSKFNLNRILGKPDASYEKFHESTKMSQPQKNPLNPSKWPVAWKIVFFKEYPRLDKIILPEPNLSSNISLKKILLTRSSKRNFSKTPLSLEKISNMLFYSAGLKDPKPPFQGQRTYPSAGARYPIEVYLISINSDLNRGVYHYNVRSHSLETLYLDDNLSMDQYFNQKWINKASIILLFTAFFTRMTMKYGTRGYRHTLTETGHIGQNIWLLSKTLNMICCGVGGYADHKLNKLLDIDGLEETVVYVIAAGNEDPNKKVYA